MTTYVQYQIATGEIVASGVTNTDVLPFVVLDGNAYLEGYGSNATQYVANGAIIDYTPQQQATKLTKPNYECAWSNTTFTWVDTRTAEQKNDEKSSDAIAKRDVLLDESDWIVIRAVDQGTPIPTDWQTYRQNLRDVPEQSGFPTNIVWPVAPT
jgi:hypothetical protein